MPASKRPVEEGGFGWAVTAGSFLMNAVEDGITFSYGILAVALIEYFEASRQQVGWVGSIMIGATYLASPLVSVLCARFGCRPISVLGAFMSGMGMVLSVFAPNVEYLFLSFGLIMGIGMSLTYLPAIVCVAYYFEKKRSLAVGIALCGSSIGIAALGYLTNYLLAEYGWRGAMLILAGIEFNCCAFGLLFVEPRTPPPRVRDVLDLDSAQTGVTKSPHPNLDLGQTEKRDLLPALEIAKHGERTTVEGKVNGHGDTEQGQGQGLGHCSAAQIVAVKAEEILTMNAEPRLSFALSQSSSSKFKSQLMDWSVFSEGLFIVFATSTFLTSVGYLVPYLFLPDRAIKMDYSAKEGALLITILGVTNTVGRVAFGYISDKPCVNRLALYSTVLTIVGLLTTLSILCADYWALASYSAIFGFLMGVYVLLTSVVLADLLGVERLSSSLSWVLLFQGVACLVGPPFAGFLFDLSGSYYMPFLVNGVLMTISGLLLYVCFCLPSYKPSVVSR